MSKYTDKANRFMTSTGTTMMVEFLDHAPYFEDDKQARDIWKITLSRNKKSFSFRFGQSVMDSGKEPTAYDVLASLTTSDPGTIENFCADYGYDTRKGNKVYKAVVKEFKGVSRLFSDVIEQLAEIQ